ncbi:hypothetical protein TWF694_008228 [Orbilia ellipsospora]|uniref:Uncharacterized protein n=1 Tax=Orbilia ellipsospora TaxID=2528407 RepID=A0AAV9XG38_9PEZI
MAKYTTRKLPSTYRDQFGDTQTLSGNGLVVPLTTIWTPPANCPTRVQSQTYYALSESRKYPCAPPYFDQVYNSWGYYSPGICPSGYTIGCYPNPTDTLNFRAIAPTETAALCVPTGYQCWDYYDNGRGLVNITSEAYEITLTALFRTPVPAFQIRWAESDLSNLETPPVQTDIVTMPAMEPSSYPEPSGGGGGYDGGSGGYYTGSTVVDATTTPVGAGGAATAPSRPNDGVRGKSGVGWAQKILLVSTILCALVL